MIKKFFLFLIFLFVIIVIATPVSAQDFWKEGPRASYEKVSQHIQGWVSDTDIQKEVKGFSSDLQSIFEFMEDIEWKYPETSPDETPLNESTADEPSEDPSASQQSLAEYEPGEYEKEVVDLVNEERAKRGLEPLILHNSLSGLADIKSQDMSNKSYFSHTSPTYGTPFEMMDQFDFTYRAAGENIAAGQRTPEEVVEGWMNSEGHRENILHEDFTHIGVGYIEGEGPYHTYWTQLFMTPR
ncbi:CAP domain-containing protein [Halobacillus litoralis]|uniref:CAP domain-containing protein n=1 Tax=Halobacillus litoralis TaxID=45668 RepID=UPI001CFE5BC3|nr:CAP domain-containing protein [Halobacillus litoralis]